MTEVARIAIFGTESTGKTTLAQRLAAHFGEPWSAEYVREFWDTHGARIEARDLDAIARGQIANEEAAAARARRVMFCDTDLLTCVMWDDLLFPGNCPVWVRTEADRRAKGMALYLLCDADVPFEPDPQRCFPEAAERARVCALWRAELEARGLPYIEIRGDWPTREAAAIAAVERVLARGK